MLFRSARPHELPKALLAANTQDILYLFVADGRAVSLPVYQLPRTTELGKGTHWADLTALSRRNHIAAALIVPAEALADDAPGTILLTTVGGVVKRVRLADLPGITSEPFVVMNVNDDDTLCHAQRTNGNDEVILFTKAGQVIRFAEEEVRTMGLPAGGVMGIKLKDEDDGVVTSDIARPGCVIWSITDNGLAKATELDQYPTQGR